MTRGRSNLELSLRRFLRQRLAMLGLVITLALALIAVFAPLLAPQPYTFANLAQANQFPSGQHPLGTDAIGHDFLSRVIYGVRTSLLVGFSAVGLACLIGLPLGLLAGLRGGRVDFVVMRVVDVMTAFYPLQFVTERVQLAQARLPQTVGAPQLMPIVAPIGALLRLCR